MWKTPFLFSTWKIVSRIVHQGLSLRVFIVQVGGVAGVVHVILADR